MDTNWGAGSENPGSHAPVLLLSGIPGSGKTAVAQALAAGLGGAAHLDAERQALLCERDVTLLARGCAARGLPVVIEAVVATRARLGRLRTLLGDDPLPAAFLAPRLTVVAQRSGPEAVARWGYLDEVMRRELGDAGTWVDSSDLTPAAAAEEIRARLLD